MIYSTRTRLTRVEVLVEENRHQIQLLAEQILAVDHKPERSREEVAEEFRAEGNGGWAPGRPE